MWKAGELITHLYILCDLLQSRRKVREPKEENVTLGPTVRDGEHVFGVAHIFASFNDTFIVSINMMVSPLELNLL